MQAGMDKRFASLMVTIRGGGASPPIGLIYAGKGNVYAKEKKDYPDNVEVFFQQKAWCDTGIMQQWVIRVWWPHILKHHIKSDGTIEPTMLFMDNLTAHQVEMVRELLKKCGTRVFFYPPGETDNLQPVDAGAAKMIKVHIAAATEAHLNDNPEIEDEFLESKFSMSTKRVILASVVGIASQKVFASQETLYKMFLKCGSYVSMVEADWVPEKCRNERGEKFLLRPPTDEERENFHFEEVLIVSKEDTVDMELAKELERQFPLKSKQKKVAKEKNTLASYFVTDGAVLNGDVDAMDEEDEEDEEDIHLCYDDDGCLIAKGVTNEIDFLEPDKTVGIFKRKDTTQPLKYHMDGFCYSACVGSVDWDDIYLDSLSGKSIIFLWDDRWMRGVVQRVNFEADKESIRCGIDINGEQHDEVNNVRVAWTDNTIEDVFLSEKTLLSQEQFCLEMAEVEKHTEYHPCHSWFLLQLGVESSDVSDKIAALNTTTYDESVAIDADEEEEEEVQILRRTGRARAASRKALGI